VQHGARWRLNNGSIGETSVFISLLQTTYWVDIAISYDINSNKIWMYADNSSQYSSTWYQADEYMYSTTNVSDSACIETPSQSFPIVDKWDTCKLIYVPEASTISGDASIQNVMILDSWISPLQFNWMRRMCHYWNYQTTQSPK
jgi:hypothetical protein